VRPLRDTTVVPGGPPQRSPLCWVPQFLHRSLDVFPLTLVSSRPSSAPTKTPCEDDPAFVYWYRLWYCTYSKTDCFQMGTLGFLNGEVKEMVYHCPVSCQACQWLEENAAGPEKIAEAAERFRDNSIISCVSPLVSPSKKLLNISNE